jgi:hypothetical protein
VVGAFVIYAVRRRTVTTRLIAMASAGFAVYVVVNLFLNPPDAWYF